VVIVVLLACDEAAGETPTIPIVATMVAARAANFIFVLRAMTGLPRCGVELLGLSMGHAVANLEAHTTHKPHALALVRCWNRSDRA
jgi:hypothetical protein